MRSLRRPGSSARFIDMTDTSPGVANPVSITFTFDPHFHWRWRHDVERLLTEPADQEYFALCASRGALLFPATLHTYMDETLMYTSEALLSVEDWKTAMSSVGAHAHQPAAAQFEGFASCIEAYLESVAAASPHGLIVDITDLTNSQVWVTTQCIVSEVFGMLDDFVEFTTMVFHHDGVSSVATMTVTSSDSQIILTLDFARDEVRAALAHHHFECVEGGEEAVIAHLNDSSTERCQQLLGLAFANPSLDVWALEKLL